MISVALLLRPYLGLALQENNDKFHAFRAERSKHHTGQTLLTHNVQFNSSDLRRQGQQGGHGNGWHGGRLFLWTIHSLSSSIQLGFCGGGRYLCSASRATWHTCGANQKD